MVYRKSDSILKISRALTVVRVDDHAYGCANMATLPAFASKVYDVACMRDLIIRNSPRTRLSKLTSEVSINERSYTLHVTVIGSNVV